MLREEYFYMDSIAIAAVLTISIVIHFLPWLIALGRNHPNTMAIFCLNLFLGWTLIGWVGALIWSVLRQK